LSGPRHRLQNVPDTWVTLSAVLRGVSMPWKECWAVDERLRFVARILEGETMSDVCRSFGISRKTGYKILNRYEESGLEALTDRSRRPIRYANTKAPSGAYLVGGPEGIFRITPSVFRRPVLGGVEDTSSYEALRSRLTHMCLMGYISAWSESSKLRPMRSGLLGFVTESPDPELTFASGACHWGTLAMPSPLAMGSRN